MKRKYYEAYDDRYKQVHNLKLQWASEEPTPIVMETMDKYAIGRNAAILELGCGEGRDAFAVLSAGYSLLATDISPAAIEYVQKKWPEFAGSFSVMDCICADTREKYDFIYAVAVLHMLVDDGDRNRFYGFIREHLKDRGVALICTMGDGTIEKQTDPQQAFAVQSRIHQQSGKEVQIAATTCRMVTMEAFREELQHNDLLVLEAGLTSALPDFSMLMYAVVSSDS